jgi:hypothetical protein
MKSGGCRSKPINLSDEFGQILFREDDVDIANDGHVAANRIRRCWSVTEWDWIFQMSGVWQLVQRRVCSTRISLYSMS